MAAKSKELIMQTPLGFSMHNVSTSHVICGIAMRNTARNWTQGLAQESVARATSRVYRASIAKGVRTETTATYPKRETCPSHDSTTPSSFDSNISRAPIRSVYTKDYLKPFPPVNYNGEFIAFRFTSSRWNFINSLPLFAIA